MSGFEISSVASRDGDVFFRELLGEFAGAMPTDDNGFFGKFEKIEIDGLSVGFVRSRGHLAIRRAARPGKILLTFPQPGNGELHINGCEFPADAICVAGEQGEIGMALRNPVNLVFLEIPVEQWRAASPYTANRDLLESLTYGAAVVRASGGLLAMNNAITQIRRAVATRNPCTSDNAGATRAAVAVATAVKAVTVRSNMPARLVASRHLFDCFKRAIGCVEEYLPAGLTVSELCTATDIHERTLQVAFRSIADLTPGQYIRYRRLADCRRMLTDACQEDVTVGGVAMAHGFLYPSQFAAYYGKAFGERPSATLRRHPGQRCRKMRARSVRLPEPPRPQQAGVARKF